MKLKAGISSSPCREVFRESSWSWLCHVCGIKLKKSGNMQNITRFAAVKLKAGISSSPFRVVSEREFLELAVSCLWDEVEEIRKHMQKSLN